MLLFFNSESIIPYRWYHIEKCIGMVGGITRSFQARFAQFVDRFISLVVYTIYIYDTRTWTPNRKLMQSYHWKNRGFSLVVACKRSNNRINLIFFAFFQRNIEKDTLARLCLCIYTITTTIKHVFLQFVWQHIARTCVFLCLYIRKCKTHIKLLFCQLFPQDMP